MSPANKLLVFDTYQRDNIPPPETKHDALPQVYSIPGNDSDDALIELTDGSVRRLIQINGTPIPFDTSDLNHLELVVERLLHCLDKRSTLQLLAINRPVDVDDYLENKLNITPKDNPYLEWYADYTKKWFRRVCDVSMVANKTFYLVVGVDGDKARDRDAQVSRLDKFANKLLRVLRSEKLSPKILNRREARTVLFSLLRLSYPSGLQQEPVEVLSSSTLPQITIKDSQQSLVIDDTEVSALSVSSVPSRLPNGWLIDVMTLMMRSALSVHFRLGNEDRVRTSADNLPSQLKRTITRKLKDTNKLIEMSVYLAVSPVSSDDKSSAKERRDEVKAKFAKHGALITASVDQFSAWTSTLPLGIDAGGPAHCVSLEDARQCWPLVTDGCGNVPGFPVGLSMMSREPVFFNHLSRAKTHAIASQQNDLNFFEALNAVRLLSANFHVLCIDAERGALSFLEEVLGDNLLNDFRSADCFDGGSLDAKKFKFRGIYTVFSSKTLSQVDLTETVKRWERVYRSAGKPLAIILADLATFSDTKGGIKQLKNLFEFADQQNILLSTLEITSRLKAHPELCDLIDSHSDTTIILPPTARDKNFVSRFLGKDKDFWPLNTLLADSETIDRSLSCILQSSDTHGLIRIIPSPMDYWLCNPLDEREKRQVLEIKDEIVDKNPKLSKTDVARQAAYYLGLRGPSVQG